MRLLYLHNTPLSSEKANIIQVLEMCNAFVDNGVKVTLSIPSHPDNKMNIIHNGKVNLVQYKKQRLFKSFNQLSCYRGAQKIINNNEYDYCYTRIPLFAKIAASKRLPALLELHNSTLNDKSKILNKFWQNYVVKNTQKGNIKKIICISNSLSEYWHSLGIGKDSILTLHDGVNIEKFSINNSISEIRRELNLPESRTIASYVGSLYDDRDIDTIIRLAGDLPDISFVVVGGPDYARMKYKAMAENKNLSNIQFIGRVNHDRVPKYLYASDILLALWSDNVPTINYCSPLKVFEYMAAGKTIIAHGYQTIKEILKDGKNAYLVQPNSYEDLKTRLKYAAMDGISNQLGTNAKIAVKNQYTWNRRVNAILESL